MFHDVTGLILDGGRAKRLGGRHKAFLEVGGQPIAERTRALFGRLFPEILVATNRPEAWAELDVRIVEDPIPDAGPLAGLTAGLEAASQPLLFAAAGDMPGLSESVIGELVERARRLPERALVPRSEGRPQVLHAVYPTSLAPVAKRLLLSGRRRLTELLDCAAVTWVEAAELRDTGAAQASFRDVDTPEDLASENRR